MRCYRSSGNATAGLTWANSVWPLPLHPVVLLPERALTWAFTSAVAGSGTTGTEARNPQNHGMGHPAARYRYRDGQGQNDG